MHLVGCLYYLYQCWTVKQVSDNEIYLLIKYIKSVLWRVAKRLSYTEEARCLKVKVSNRGVQLGCPCKGKNTDWNFRNGCSEGGIFQHSSGKQIKQYAVVTNPTDKIHVFLCFNLQNPHMFLAPLAHHQGVRVYQSVVRPYYLHSSVYFR